MPYRIWENRGRLEIEIEAPAPARQSFLDLLDACTHGECGCPALRCGTAVTTIPGAPDAPMRIVLTPHPGVRVDTRLIERCLAFTLGCGKPCARAGSA